MSTRVVAVISEPPPQPHPPKPVPSPPFPSPSATPSKPLPTPANSLPLYAHQEEARRENQVYYRENAKQREHFELFYKSLTKKKAPPRPDQAYIIQKSGESKERDCEMVGHLFQ